MPKIQSTIALPKDIPNNNDHKFNLLLISLGILYLFNPKDITTIQLSSLAVVLGATLLYQQQILNWCNRNLKGITLVVGGLYALCCWDAARTINYIFEIESELIHYSAATYAIAS